MSYFSVENKVQVGIGTGLNRMPVSNLVRSIFSNGGYDGFILDANDIFTLNQVSTGTTPVTAVTQPIGLMLDKHLGMQLGPELSSPAIWSPTADTTKDISAGTFTTTNSSGFGSGCDITQAVIAGKTYKVTFTIDFVVAGSGVSLRLGFTDDGSFTTSGTYTSIITASATNAAVIFAIAAGSTFTVSGVSVKLLDGNHPLQATGPARPTWQVDANGHHYAQFLGTDDSLSSATGGGGSTGFLFCAALKPTGGAGTGRILYSDAGSLNGYIVQVLSDNKLYLSAGNGSGYVSVISAATVDVGTTYLLTCCDDGANLNVQINSATAQTIARPVVVAGTAGYTVGKDNAAASAFLIADFYRAVYIKNWAGTAAQLAAIQSWVKAGAGL